MDAINSFVHDFVIRLHTTTDNPPSATPLRDMTQALRDLILTNYDLTEISPDALVAIGNLLLLLIHYHDELGMFRTIFRKNLAYARIAARS